MSLRLAMFVADMQEELLEFKERYVDKHNINPEQYPLYMKDGQEGLWLEFFLNFLEDGKV